MASFKVDTKAIDAAAKEANVLADGFVAAGVGDLFTDLRSFMIGATAGSSFHDIAARVAVLSKKISDEATGYSKMLTANNHNYNEAEQTNSSNYIPVGAGSMSGLSFVAPANSYRNVDLP